MRKILMLIFLFLLFNSFEIPWPPKKRGKLLIHAPRPVYGIPHPRLMGAAEGKRTDLYARKPEAPKEKLPTGRHLIFKTPMGFISYLHAKKGKY